MPSRRSYWTAIAIVAVALIAALFWISQDDDPAPGQPSPHAIDQDP